jgi:peptide/nickel transport system permease protein/glutathione transport system permease protein
MLSEARQHYLSHPYLGIPAGLILMMAVLGFSLLGDYVNDLWIGGLHEDD